MCHHTTTVYRCHRCTAKIFTDTITCSAAWYKRVGRQQCDNTDWTMVEDRSEKLCAACAERCSPNPVVMESTALAVSEPPSPVEVASVFGTLSEFDSYTAPYVNARLGDWLRRHPEREGADVRADIVGMGDLMVALSGLEVVVAGDAASSSGAELSGSTLTAELEGSCPVLFADALTQSPEAIEIDECGFEQQKVSGGKDWTLNAK